MSHSTEIRVRFYELDPYDHVNHTNYFAYFETARVEYLNDVGYGMAVMKERGFQIVVVELTARFLAAAGLGDLLTVTTRVVDIGRVTSTWSQDMTRDAKPIATLDVKAAFTDLTGRPRRVPEEFAAAFA